MFLLVENKSIPSLCRGCSECIVVPSKSYLFYLILIFLEISNISKRTSTINYCTFIKKGKSIK